MNIEIEFSLAIDFCFPSERKRMSVIVRTPQNQIKLFCKGAVSPSKHLIDCSTFHFQDSVIMERLVADDRNASLTMEHLECFAKDGLRTLCLGYRVLTNEEYNVNVNR